MRAAFFCIRNCAAALSTLRTRSSGKFPNGAWHRPGRASGILALNASGKIAGSIWTCGTFRFDFVRVKNSRSLLSTKTWSTVSSTKVRSEEHTSELQSRLHLVCRLLLEKKKKHIQQQ